MHRGGYPELWATDLVPERYFSDYVATYLERDVRQAINVRSLRDFERFLRLCAIRTGQLVNTNALATDVGVSVNTVKSWLSVLEASNVIYLLPPYFRNLGKRVVKAPKLYFLDTGLCSYLAGFRNASDLNDSPLVGAFFESLAVGQVVRAYANRGLTPPLYFFRDHHGHEVDIVIPVGDRVHLLECKWAERATVSKSFEAVARAFGEDHVLSRMVVTTARDPAVGQGSAKRTNAVDFGWLFPDEARSGKPGPGV
jgi:predicted AAA+ superfamily ATPase